MSKSIIYKVEFLTDWHCGSGLSSGADLDLLVIKDKTNKNDKIGLPFIPGKTIKGLIREAVEEINGFVGADLRVRPDKIIAVFGEEGKSQGCCFFTNVVLKKDLQKSIVSHKLQEHLYRSVASTAIGDNGIAVEHSLRKMEVTVPCTLEGEILDVPDDFVEIMEKGLKFIKRLGQNRNRGLGRCIIIIEEGGKNENTIF